MELSWHKKDIEEKLGFKSQKYSGVNTVLAFFVAIVFMLFFYSCAYIALDYGKFEVAAMFFHGGERDRSIVPYFIVFLSSWSLAILFLKNQKLKLQQKALYLDLVPDDQDFVLSPATSAQVLRTLYNKVDEPRRFMLLNRIERALANLKNIGRISELAEGLNVQAENDESYIESTYTVVRGFIWAVPVLGFIGTVLGLSQAIGGFGEVVASGSGITALTSSLQNVTAGLSIAFETTLIGLVAALIIQLLATMVRKKEEDFLDNCADYCHRDIIGKLKTMHEREAFLANEEESE